MAKQSIKPFAAPLFPFEKDWRAYFEDKGIGGTAYISADRIRMVHKGTEVESFFEKAQSFFVRLLERAFLPGRDRDVAEAMLLGVKTKIDFETLSTYSALGAIHILSVSGLHVGLLYMGLGFLLGFLWRRRPVGPYVFFVLMMALLWSYAGISGFSLPVLRSAWMFSVILFAKTFLRRQQSLNTLAFSAFVLLFIHPASIYDPGFQLSYLAVWGLIAFQQRWAQLLKFKGCLRWPLTQTWELTCIALAAQVLTWPLIVYYFHQLPHPLSFFILNPFLILFSSIALFLGFLFLGIGAFLPEWAFQPFAFVVSGSFRLLHGLMFGWVFSKEARTKAEAELKKLRNMSPMSAESTVVRNYLDWLLSLPWGKAKTKKIDVAAAERILDEDHYGLEKVKERILEYLAVQSRTNSLKGPILCLVGPIHTLIGVRTG